MQNAENGHSVKKSVRRTKSRIFVKAEETFHHTGPLTDVAVWEVVSVVYFLSSLMMIVRPFVEY
jgi:hypothetical protein